MDPAIPVPAATVVVLRPAPDGFEVLMVERNSRGQFGDLVVFPGGAVDLIDPDDRFTALRELAEETGLLALEDGLQSAPPLRGRELYGWLAASGRNLAIGDLLLISRWVTPEPVARRFDTRFYLLAVSEPPPIVLDMTELVSHSWVTPRDALHRHDSGRWAMILPTLAHLRWLARRESVDDAMRSAQGADGRTLITPRVVEDGSLVPVYLPGERG